MFIEIIKAVVYITCYFIALSFSFFLDMLYENGSITGEYASLIVISPIILINIAFGIFTFKFKQVIPYSIYGSLVLTAVAYIEHYFDPVEPPPQPDITDLAFTNPIPYGLMIIGISFLFSLVPLSIGWMLGKLKLLTFGK